MPDGGPDRARRYCQCASCTTSAPDGYGDRAGEPERPLVVPLVLSCESAPLAPPAQPGPSACDSRTPLPGADAHWQRRRRPPEPGTPRWHRCSRPSSGRRGGRPGRSSGDDERARPSGCSPAPPGSTQDAAAGRPAAPQRRRSTPLRCCEPASNEAARLTARRRASREWLPERMRPRTRPPAAKTKLLVWF